jgi:alpha-amylase
MEFFLGNAAQQAVLQLMIHTYGVARLTEDPALLDIALWLAQSDNLHLIQWFGRGGSEAEVSAYFTPREWWDLGPDRIIVEQQRVYTNVLRAMERYLPARRAAREAADRAIRERFAALREREAVAHERGVLELAAW